jgi:hypothetical protein
VIVVLVALVLGFSAVLFVCHSPTVNEQHNCMHLHTSMHLFFYNVAQLHHVYCRSLIKMSINGVSLNNGNFAKSNKKQSKQNFLHIHIHKNKVKKV